MSRVTSFHLHAVGRKSRRNCRLTFIREMLARAGHEPRPSMPVGRPAQTSTNILRLDMRHNKHWPVRSPTQWRCRVCSPRGVTRSVKFKCLKCDVALGGILIWNGQSYCNLLPFYVRHLSNGMFFVKYLYIFVFKVLLNRSIMAPLVSEL